VPLPHLLLVNLGTPDAPTPESVAGPCHCVISRLTFQSRFDLEKWPNPATDTVLGQLPERGVKRVAAITPVGVAPRRDGVCLVMVKITRPHAAPLCVPRDAEMRRRAQPRPHGWECA
jgi:hypothetical protein